VESRPQTPIKSGCSRPFKACLAVLILVTVTVIGLLIYAIRTPAIRGLVRCQSNMAEIGAALRRYADLHGSYPDDLSAIRKEYLKNPNVLRCPLDTSVNDRPSYIYHQPKPNSGPNFVVLVCPHHRFSTETPPARLVYLKKGIVKLELIEETDSKQHTNTKKSTKNKGMRKHPLGEE